MARERNALKAGIFIVVSVALALAIVFAIKGAAGFLEPLEVYSVNFTLKDDVGGLRVGDDVRIGGFKVGTVRAIEVVTSEAVRLPQAAATQPIGEEKTLIRVTFTLPRRYELRENARLAIQGTVTGQSWLNFEELGDASANVLTPDVSLVGRPSALTTLLASLDRAGPRLDSILRQVDEQTIPNVTGLVSEVRTSTRPLVDEAIGRTAGSLQETASTGTGFIKELQGYLKPVFERYERVTSSATGMMDEVRDVFGESKGDFRGTVANLNAATGAVRERLPGMLEKADGLLTNVNSAVSKANEALLDIKTTVENTRDATGAARSILVGNRSRIDGMIASLKTTGDNLKSGSAELRRSPWRLLYKPAKGEMENLDLYDSARQFAEGANDLNDAVQALRDAIDSKEEDSDKLQRLLDHVHKSFANFTEVEQNLWRRVKE